MGKRIAEKAKAAGVDSVAFDRSGFRYHGRIKALADAAARADSSFSVPSNYENEYGDKAEQISVDSEGFIEQLINVRRVARS